MKTILFADDNTAIVEHCRQLLEDEGYRVLAASNGEEAVRLFTEFGADIAVLDISMPRMSGIDALERLKELLPHLPVILFTAYDEDCLRDRRGALAEACIEKSDDLAELKRTIERLLETTICGTAKAAVVGLGLPPSGCTVSE